MLVQSFCPESVLDDSGDAQHRARLDGALLLEGREVGQFPLAQASHLCLSISPSKNFSSQVKITKFYFLQKLTF